MGHPSKNQRASNKINKHLDLLENLPAADQGFIALAATQLEAYQQGRRFHAESATASRQSRSRSPRRSNRPALPSPRRPQLSTTRQTARSSHPRTQHNQKQFPAASRRQDLNTTSRSSIEDFIARQAIRAREVIEDRAVRGQKVLEQLADEERAAIETNLQRIQFEDRDNIAVLDQELYGSEADPSTN